MYRLAINEKVASFIKAYFIKDSGVILFNDTLLLENRLIDSIGVIALVLFLEATFGISVENEERIPENLNSLNRIFDYVLAKIPQTIAT